MAGNMKTKIMSKKFLFGLFIFHLKAIEEIKQALAESQKP